MKKKTAADFENIHGQPKIKRLEQRIAQEHAKVEALAGVQNKVNIMRQAGGDIRFGLISDTHIGSLYAKTETLAGVYRYFAAQGVKMVFHAGDVIDGHKVYKGQEFELRDIGVEAQVSRLAEAVEHMPQIETRFITGNHDQSFKNLAGAPVGKLIESATGWKFLGEEQARVKWETAQGDFTLMLLHPGGGSAYAVSYKPQKITESLEGGTKPDMLAIGHYHKAEFMPSYRNVGVVQSGTLCRQTPFMARLGLSAHIGAWLFDVSVGDGYNVIKAEFVAVYV